MFVAYVKKVLNFGMMTCVNVYNSIKNYFVEIILVLILLIIPITFAILSTDNEMNYSSSMSKEFILEDTRLVCTKTDSKTRKIFLPFGKILSPIQIESNECIEYSKGDSNANN